MSKNKTLDVYYKNKHVGTLAEMVGASLRDFPEHDGACGRYI